MPLYVVLAALAVALSIPVMAFSLAGDRGSRGRVARNLCRGLSAPTDQRRLVLAQAGPGWVPEPAFRLLSRWARGLSPAGVVTHLERHIVLAGLSVPVDLILMAKVALAGLLGTGGVLVLMRSPSVRSLFFAVLAGFIGYLGPDVVLARRAKKRQLSIGHELPDMLDQVTVCVEAGLGFDAALARTTRSANTPLSVEVARLHQELRIGVPRREALDNLLARTDVPALRQFTHALVQAESYGVPVSQMLRVQAGEHREKRRQVAEERAMKLPVKISFPLVLCVLPSMFVVILGPAVLNLMNQGF